MNLDIENNFLNNLKEKNLVRNFIKELSHYLENGKKSNLDCENREIPIIENILAKNNFTTGNQNSIRWNLKDVVLKYAQKSSKNDAIYFVKDTKGDNYTVLKAENGKIEKIEINKNNISSKIKVNDVLKFQNNNYIVDDISTKELQEEIKNMANEILDKQNVNLNKKRKEGHLYLVVEELENNRFLLDLTEAKKDAPKNEFEEVDIPKDLLNVATEGMVLKYVNGKYEYYSDDGFERLEKID